MSAFKFFHWNLVGNTPHTKQNEYEDILHCQDLTEFEMLHGKL